MVSITICKYLYIHNISPHLCIHNNFLSFIVNLDEQIFIYIQYLSKESDILFCSITHANLGQILKPGTDLESAGPEVFKTPPTCAI